MSLLKGPLHHEYAVHITVSKCYVYTKHLGIGLKQLLGPFDPCHMNYSNVHAALLTSQKLAASLISHGMQSVQDEPEKSIGRYNVNLTLTLYPQQQLVLTPKDVAELGRNDMVLLWKVPPHAWPCCDLSAMICKGVYVIRERYVPLLESIAGNAHVLLVRDSMVHSIQHTGEMPHYSRG